MFEQKAFKLFNKKKAPVYSICIFCCLIKDDKKRNVCMKKNF